MANMQTGEIKNWDDLTPEQQQSGEWFKLPIDAGEVVRAQHDPAARARGIMAEAFKPRDAVESINRLFAPRGTFDATGKPNV